MSIRGFAEKIKDFLGQDHLFYGLLIILVAILFFGIGRLSATWVPVDQKMAQTIQKIESRASTLEADQEKGVEKDGPQSTGSPVQEVDRPVEKQAVATTSIPALYVGSKNSSKYHLPWCSGAKRIAQENKVFFASKEEAEKAGYTPAGNCPGI